MMDSTRQDGSGRWSSQASGMTRRSALALAAAAAAAAAMPRPVLAQAPTLKVGMANQFMSVTYPYITNAQALGYFEEAGVNIEVIMGQGSPQILSLLIAKTIDLCYCNPEPVIQLVADRGEKLKSVFSSMEAQYILAVDENSPIRDVPDLKGKRLGMFGPQSGIDYLLVRLLDAGLKQEDLTIVPTGFGAQVVHAVQNKQVDAILYWSDALSLFTLSGLKLRELPKASWEHGMYQYVATTREDVIAGKSEALRSALRGMAQGQMMSVVSPTLTVEAFWKQFPDQAPKPGEREKALSQNLYRVERQNRLVGLPENADKATIMKFAWGEQSLDAWSRIQDKLVRVGTLKNRTEPARFFDNRFIAYANDFDRQALYERARKGL